MPEVPLYQRASRAIGRLRAVLVPLGGGDFGELLLRLLCLIYAQLYPLKLRYGLSTCQEKGSLKGLPLIGRFRRIFR